MSVFVFAGSAQFIAMGMIGAGNSIGTIVVTTFLVNLRHLLMSAALSPHLRGLSHKELALFGFQLTDETFALHSTRFREGVPDVLESLALNGTAQASWVLGTIVGVLVGGGVSDVEGLGMYYALPAMFIALVFIQVHNSTYFTVGALGGLRPWFSRLQEWVPGVLLRLRYWRQQQGWSWNNGKPDSPDNPVDNGCDLCTKNSSLTVPDQVQSSKWCDFVVEIYPGGSAVCAAVSFYTLTRG